MRKLEEKLRRATIIPKMEKLVKEIRGILKGTRLHFERELEAA